MSFLMALAGVVGAILSLGVVMFTFFWMLALFDDDNAIGGSIVMSAFILEITTLVWFVAGGPWQ